MLKVLLIESDRITGEILQDQIISKLDYSVNVCTNAEDAIVELKKSKYNLVIISLELAQGDGWEVLESIKQANIKLAKIVLSTSKLESYQLKAYDYEIEEYVVMPINYDILMKKIKAIMRRNEMPQTSENVVFIPEFYKVVINNVEYKLPKKEFQVLNYLYLNSNSICSKEQIIADVWQTKKVMSNRVVDYTIKRIRGNLGASNKGLIKTKVGVGYYYDSNAEF